MEKKMNKLYFMIGLMNSGKSTQCDLLKSQGVNVYSSDDIRMELFGTYDCMDKHKEVFDTLYKRAKQDLLDGKDVCIDATNLTYKSRRLSFLQLDLDNIDCRKIAIVMATPIEVCIERNAKRERKVPEDVIYKAREKFEFPMHYEFDEVEIVYAEEVDNFDKATRYLNNIVESTYGFNQKTKYHTLLLFDHLIKAREFIKDNSKSWTLFLAVGLHDLGKLFTQSFDEDGNAHYYNHENVSAYDVCVSSQNFVFISNESVCEIIQLINWHMRPYHWKEEKTINKYKKLLGEQFFNDLMLIHEADKFAH